MTERNLFNELIEGMVAWSDFNAGKKTLRTHKIKKGVKVPLSPIELKAVREKLNLSQAVFARYLHAGEKTYQNWEQGLARPNPQAVLLIRMLDQNPDTLNTLASL